MPLESDSWGMVETWEALCDQGRDAAQDMDGGRWTLGDLSLEVQKQYGRNRISDFAREVNVPVGRVEEYRTVCRYYPKSVRADILGDNPLLSYSHFRVAMRFRDIEESIEFLMECADGAYTIERSMVEIKKRLNKPVPPPKLLDAEGTLRHADLETGMVVTKIGEGANLTELQKWRDKAVRVVIYGVESEENDADRLS